MEWNIGEIKQVKGEWYQCVESQDGSCKHCDMNFEGKCPIPIKECTESGRSDKSYVIFKKLEKVGEPYEHYGKLYQCYKLPMETEIRIVPDNCYPIGKDNLVEIEIKENKEDMEEEKHSNLENTGKNMKPFDLQKAKAGKPVCTRDGRKARIICFDRKFYHDDGYNYPIVAMVNGSNDNELVHAYTQDGLLVGNMKGDLDLMMLPEKKEGWVNVYKDSVYDTKDEALIGRSESRGYIDTEITDYKPYVDWEKRKYDIAKEAMLKMIDPNAKTQNYGVMAINAVEIAIHLIDKLKKVN